jgi:hypothetical protein
MKAYRGRRIIAPLILNFGPRWRLAVIFTFRPLYPGKEPRYLLLRTPAELQSPSGRFEVGENFSTLQEFEPRTVQAIAQSIYRLR